MEEMGITPLGSNLWVFSPSRDSDGGSAWLLRTTAGRTVLLPCVGPMVSGGLTVGTCVVTGHADPTLLVLVGSTYVIMNMVVEQLFLYPAFVGEALGLNILETLIVVLLGGLFAGLAGMIFAVPVASVLKFLIPRLYQSMRAGDELALPESGGATTVD